MKLKRIRTEELDDVIRRTGATGGILLLVGPGGFQSLSGGPDARLHPLLEEACTAMKNGIGAALGVVQTAPDMRAECTAAPPELGLTLPRLTRP